MNKLRNLLSVLPILLMFLGCTHSNLIDSNVNMSENKWIYTAPIREKFEVKDNKQGYEIYFKLRHTAAYRYSNMYVFFRLKGEGFKKSIRYEFKLAKQDGQWLGKGSGDLFTHDFPLLKNYHFPKAGKYEIEIEQNMRDNPLIGISDVGLTVVPTDAR